MAVCAGEVGGQALALGLVDEVAMDVVPGGVRLGQALLRLGWTRQHLLDDPDVVIQGDRVLHLRLQRCAAGPAASTGR